MVKKYDSRKDTKAHISMVEKEIKAFIFRLKERALNHDESKLNPPEKECFDRVTPLLKKLEYGSEEYKKVLSEMDEALEHHYDNNKHHPEHFPNGISDMSIVDIIEMICDWNAARKRHTNPKSFKESLEINVKRFNIPEPIARLIENTAKDMFMWE